MKRISNKTKDVIFIVLFLSFIAGIIIAIGVFASSLFANTKQEKKILTEDEARLERVVYFCTLKNDLGGKKNA